MAGCHCLHWRCWQGLKQKLIGCSKSSCHSNRCGRALFLHLLPSRTHAHTPGWSPVSLPFPPPSVMDGSALRVPHQTGTAQCPLSLQFPAGVGAALHPTNHLWLSTVSPPVSLPGFLCSPECGGISGSPQRPPRSRAECAVMSHPRWDDIAHPAFDSPANTGGIHAGRFVGTLNHGRMLIIQFHSVVKLLKLACF